MTLRVLVVDDDERLQALIASYLEQNDVSPAAAENGRRALDLLEREAFDAVLLDVMMPGMDGLTVLKSLRARWPSLPVIMLTAKGDETDRVVGLELGADDYLAKPFSPRELLARIKAVLRRAMPDLDRQRLSAGDVVVEVESRSVRVAGEPVELTGLEFDLLLALIRRAGHVVPRASLLAQAGRGDVIVNERAVDVHISHLRKKLGDDPPKLIKTVRGVGYVLSKDTELRPGPFRGGPHGHGHGHGGWHGRLHGHGEAFPFEVPRRSRLHRRLFLWFGATIALTGCVVGAVVALFGPGTWQWKDDHARFRELGRSEFSRSWDRPDDRRALTNAVAHAFRADVTVEDASGRIIEQVGARCVRGYELDVRRGDALLGRVRGCIEPRPHPRGTFFIGFFAALVTIWTASAFIARRLTRPLAELARVTNAIGSGDLAARVRLGRHQTGEVGALADSVNEMAVRIETMLREERELLAAVSHELRSPLARLRVLVELARSGAPGERLAEIEREVLGIDALIGKLLASSRLEFGAARPQTLVANEAAARALEAASVPPEVLDDETNGATVEADPTLLARALGNLLENAIQHAGGVERLTIRAATSGAGTPPDDANAVIRFEVKDKGPGFASDVLSRAFEPFTRGAQKAEGSASLGLGLSLVARIARAHGGQAFAENPPGGGALVVIELPKPKS